MSERQLTATANAAVWIAIAAVLAAPWVFATRSEVPALWWASRAFGFVAYVALWLAMLTGVLLSSARLPGPLDRKVLFELHQQWTLSAVIATALHVLATVTHPHSEIGTAEALIPYASAQLRGPMALGTLALWLLALLAVSSWLRTHLSATVWRLIHTLAFASFVLALVHSVSAGTDTSFTVVRLLYVTSGLVLGAAVVLRTLPKARQRSPERRTHSSSRPR